jgi:hypothetical protein
MPALLESLDVTGVGASRSLANQLRSGQDARTHYSLLKHSQANLAAPTIPA